MLEAEDSEIPDNELRELVLREIYTKGQSTPPYKCKIII
jgi:hypothetical protein